MFAVLAAWLASCSGESPPPGSVLPDGVMAAIVYNEHAERWHAGAMVMGDHPDSMLRVVCLTEAGKPWEDSGSEHTGINIDAQPGNLDGLSGLDWSWRLDGRRWDGGRWSFDFNTGPPTLVAVDMDVEAAFFRDLPGAEIAELIGVRTDEEQVSIQFDVTTLLSTPVQFAIDECDEEAIEERTGDYHSAYAYWIPDWKRHSITLTELDPATERRLLLTCGPASWTDDDAPDWIREAKGGVYAAAMLIAFPDDSNLSHDQADTQSVESATVSWVDDDGRVGTAVWDVNYGWLRPPSAQENLRFIDALRGSEELSVTVEVDDEAPVEVKLRGAALFAKPLGAELDTCIREYAEQNG